MVVVIPLALLLSWVGIVEAHPSAIESSLVSNERLDSFNGGLQSHEAFFKKRIDVVRPMTDCRIEGAQLGQDGRAEGTMGAAHSILSISLPVEVNLDEQANANSGNSKEPKLGRTKVNSEEIHPGLWLFLFGLALPLFSEKKSDRVR